MSSFMFAGVWSIIGSWLARALMELSFLIDSVVYAFINWMYRIFMLVAEVDIFQNNTAINDITRRLYVVVGVIMLFIFAYNLILLVVNPEGNQIGDMGKIVSKAVVSVILVTLLPVFFSAISRIQSDILKSNVLSQIILGTSSEADLNTINKQAGLQTSLDIYSAFFHPEGQSVASCKENMSAHPLCQDYVDAYNDAFKSQEFSRFLKKQSLRNGVISGDMEYTWVISWIAGGFAVWMFLTFVIDVGVRVCKMAFYEVISPIPIMMRILPGDKMFDKWFKGITSTFLSLFIRLAVIYFGMYAATLVPTVLGNLLTAKGETNPVIILLANVVVILGVLRFIQEAPKLLSDLFGGSGDLAPLSLKKRFENHPIKTPINMARSGVYAKAYGKTVDEDGNEIDTGGFFRGAWRGRHGYKEGVSTTDDLVKRGQSGATFGDVMEDKARVAVGLKTAYEARDYEEQKRLIAAGTEELKESNKELKESISSLDEAVKASVEKMKTNLGEVNGYELKGTFKQMEEVLQQAIRDKADGATISAIQKKINDSRKETTKGLTDAAITGNFSDEQRAAISDDMMHIMEISAKNIKDHMEKTGISTQDENGKWVVQHEIKMDEHGRADVGQLSTQLKISDIDISEVEGKIKEELRGPKYKAKKGSSDWVRRNGGGSGKG